jgi:hypothetical protein
MIIIIMIMIIIIIKLKNIAITMPCNLTNVRHEDGQ